MNKEKCGLKKLHKGFWLSLCAAVVTLVCCVAVFAGVQAADTSDWNYAPNSTGDGYVVVTSNSNVSGAITIPETYDGKPVVEIGRDAFLNCAGLTSITIPSSVKSIGWYAFSGCTGLTSITIPSSVTEIDWFAFANCTGLTTATIGGNCEIGAGAFSGCTSLTDVTIQSGITTIGWSAFKGCTKLSSISIPASVTSVDRYAFYNCTVSKVIYCGTQEQWNAVLIDNSGNDSLKSATVQLHNYEDGTCTVCGHSNSPLTFTLNAAGNGYVVSECDQAASGELVIPATYKGLPVTGIGENAFYNCAGLTNITIPDSVTSIGVSAFEICHGLTNVTIGNGVTSIGEAAFFNCDGLTSVTIPASVTSMGNGAFSYCYRLSNITIADGATSIGDYAFQSCTGLTSITIPNSVTTIGLGAFSGCSSLESMTIPFVGNSNKTASDTYQYPFGYVFGTERYDGSIETRQMYYGSSAFSVTYET